MDREKLQQAVELLNSITSSLQQSQEIESKESHNGPGEAAASSRAA